MIRMIKQKIDIAIIGAANLGAWFGNIESGLKIALSIASLGYVLDRWYHFRKTRKQKE